MNSNPIRFDGTVVANGSKSHAQRLLLLSAIVQGKSSIHALDFNADTLAMMAALKHLGCRLELQENTLNVTSPAEQEIQAFIKLDVGESGFALRTLAFVAMHFYETVELLGHKTLQNRQHLACIQLLEQAGFKVTHHEGKLPIRIQRQHQHQRLQMDGSAGSQYITGLLYYALAQGGQWEFTIQHLKSAPYLALSIETAKACGFQISGSLESVALDNPNKPIGFEAKVEGDWSSMAVHVAAASIAGKVNISGLKKDSLQADMQLLEIIRAFGAQYSWQQEVLTIDKAKNPAAFTCDLNQAPDLFPVVVVLACAAKGTSTIIGTNRLQNKESDRLAVMCEALSKWGVAYEQQPDQLQIHGVAQLQPATIACASDHRVVMAANLANLLMPTACEVADQEAVTKSYPNFFSDWNRLVKH
ncbi:MAG: hypothetical protein RLZZ301_588 [Bacteroidota bacterium]|jgi:3-phosphoshikimate 1-carboxyvinyltransferase